MSNRYSFTLLEMMVTLMLLSLIGSVITVQAAKLIKTHRFEKEIRTLFTALQEVQILAVTHQTELKLDLLLEKGVFYYQITTDEPLEEVILSQNPMPLATVEKILFDGKKLQKWHFEITSRGNFSPRGVLSFSTKEDAQVRYIDFQYGSLIRYFAVPPPRITQVLPDFPKGLS